MACPGALGIHECERCKGRGKVTSYDYMETAGLDLVADWEKIRDVDLYGYRLELWDTNKRVGMRDQIAYRLSLPRGIVIFEGDEYSAGAVAIDSDESLRGLISFLTLQDGDTDDEYFHKYTRTQLTFTQGDAEDLSHWSCEPEDCDLEDAEKDEEGNIVWFKDWEDEEAPVEDLQRDGGG